MRFDVVDIYLLRYPYGDDLLNDIVLAAALPDATGLVPRILEKLSCSEIKMKAIEDPEDTVEFCSMYRPDVLLVNLNVVREEYMEIVTEQLAENLTQMPALVGIVDNKYVKRSEYTEKYNGYYYVPDSMNIAQSAENIKQFLLTKLVSTDYLREKLRVCTAQTLYAMKCNHTSRGFRLLVDCVLVILQSPYVRAEYYKEVVEKTALKMKMDSGRVEDLMKETVKDALANMSPFERAVSFPKQSENETEPTYVDFIYTAAEITSKPCKKILRYIEDEPFLSKDKSEIFI